MSDAAPQAGSPETEAGAGDPEARTGSDAAPPAPLGVPRTPTGDAGVDAVLRRLAAADHLATDGHVAVYEDVHRGLRDALTALDARQGPPVPTGRPTTTPRRGASGHESDAPYENRS
ncbi:hypothetical protein ABZ023_21125 [Streptomyces sp. NPDC006367]|uniref:hypothetical protein n=1 Tax=unclassified Streptomyces TaxID=2593676 RepID=UPI0033A18E8A